MLIFSTTMKKNKMINNKTKINRFINSFLKSEKIKKGFCNPDKCETLNGEKGAACCKLGCKCWALKEKNCKIYNLRFRNCRVFPANEQDLNLVKNCSYYFE